MTKTCAFWCWKFGAYPFHNCQTWVYQGRIKFEDDANIELTEFQHRKMMEHVRLLLLPQEVKGCKVTVFLPRLRATPAYFDKRGHVSTLEAIRGH